MGERRRFGGGLGLGHGEGLGHSVQPQTVELIERGMGEHACPQW